MWLSDTVENKEKVHFLTDYYVTNEFGLKIQQ